MDYVKTNSITCGPLANYQAGAYIYCFQKVADKFCFSYDGDDDLWAVTESLNLARSGAASTQMRNGTWIVTGGFNDENHNGLDSTEASKDYTKRSAQKLVWKTFIRS
jgi:N-acetylneuraminic acid mutarotase